MSRAAKNWAGAGVLAASLLLLAGPNQAQTPTPTPAPAPAPAPAEPAAPPTPMVIGFIDLADDPRFNPDWAYAMVPGRSWGPAFDGARLALGDALQIGRAINVEFSLRHASGANVDELAAEIGAWVAEGIHFVGVDLPADMLLQLADRVRNLPVTLFNTSAPEDSLRGADCRANIIHTVPSDRMHTDALVQYLVSKRWRNILVLQGPSPRDAEVLAALRESVNTFGARITNVRPFLFTADPEARELNNVALMTAGGGYDVVWVIDDDAGEFARYVPYTVNDPRPVVGAAGLVPLAWHWSWERQGAPQVNDRFEDLTGRRMTDTDWAAWAAVRAVTQGVLRSRTTEYEPARDFILGDRMNLDGYKGYPMSVRPWDHQLRQPMLLAVENATIQLAPVEGFLHQINDLDTLGVDAPQSQCRF